MVVYKKPLEVHRPFCKSHFILQFTRRCQRNGSKPKELLAQDPHFSWEYYGRRHITCLTALPSNYLVVFISQGEVQSNSKIFLLQTKFNLSCKLPPKHNTLHQLEQNWATWFLCVSWQSCSMWLIGKKISHLHFHLISEKRKNLDCCRFSNARQTPCCEESHTYFLLEIVHI